MVLVRTLFVPTTFLMALHSPKTGFPPLRFHRQLAVLMQVSWLLTVVLVLRARRNLKFPFFANECTWVAVPALLHLVPPTGVRYCRANWLISI